MACRFVVVGGKGDFLGRRHDERKSMESDLRPDLIDKEGIWDEFLINIYLTGVICTKLRCPMIFGNHDAFRATPMGHDIACPKSIKALFGL